MFPKIVSLRIMPKEDIEKKVNEIGDDTTVLEILGRPDSISSSLFDKILERVVDLPRIDTLIIAGFYMYASHLEMLCKALVKNPLITTLTLHYLDDLSALGEILSKNLVPIKTLSISMISSRRSEAIIDNDIVRALSTNRTVTTLTFGAMYGFLSAMKKTLKKNVTLSYLHYDAFFDRDYFILGEKINKKLHENRKRNATLYDMLIYALRKDGFFDKE